MQRKHHSHQYVQQALQSSIHMRIEKVSSCDSYYLSNLRTVMPSFIEMRQNDNSMAESILLIPLYKRIYPSVGQSTHRLVDQSSPSLIRRETLLKRGRDCLISFSEFSHQEVSYGLWCLFPALRCTPVVVRLQTGSGPDRGQSLVLICYTDALISSSLA